MSKHRKPIYLLVVLILCLMSSTSLPIVPYQRVSSKLFSSLILTETLKRYQNHAEIGEGSSKGVSGTQEQYPKYSDVLSNTELLQIVDRELGGDQQGDQLSVTDLVNLEKQFQEALTQARTTKTHLLLDSISSLHEKEKMLSEEKRSLEDKEKMLAEEKKSLEEKVAQSNTNKRANNTILDLNFLAE